MRKIIIKDFDHFTDRNMNQDNINPKANKQFSKVLTVMCGEKWRSAREMITPTFTTGHIKAAQIHVQSSAQELIQYIKNIDRNDVDLKMLFNRSSWPSTFIFYRVNIYGP